MLLASNSHGLGNTTRWEVDYSQWLVNPAVIVTATVTSSSTTCTVQSSQILGTSVIFFLTGGVLNEVPVVTMNITDSYGNTKIDTIQFTVVAQ